MGVVGFLAKLLRKARREPTLLLFWGANSRGLRLMMCETVFFRACPGAMARRVCGANRYETVVVAL
jgi:hypothetical protein